MTKHASIKSRRIRVAAFFAGSAIIGAALGTGIAYGAIAIGVNL